MVYLGARTKYSRPKIGTQLWVNAGERLPGKVIAVDTETDGLDVYHGNRIFAYAFCNVNGRSVVKLDKMEGMRNCVRKWMADPNVIKVFHNAKFDLKMLAANDIRVAGRIHDTMVMAHLLGAQGKAGPKHKENCLKRLSLEVLSEKYLQQPKSDAVKMWIRKNTKSFTEENGRPPNYSDVPKDILIPYAKRDVENTLQLFYVFLAPLKRLKLWDLYLNEMELLQYIIKMENRGIRLDEPYMLERIKELTAKEVKSEAILRKLLEPIRLKRTRTRTRKGKKVRSNYIQVIQPKDINLGSDLQLIPVVYGQFNNPIGARTKSGQPSMDERALSRFDCEFTKELIRWRQYIKVRDTYFIGYREHLDNGILHPNYAQIGTQTGRFSSSNPNLQNIPMEDVVRERAGAEVVFKGVKKAFIPREDFQNWHFDYSQIELRIFAHESKDKRVVNIMTSGRDLHSETCQALYGEISEKLRVLAKIVNFGILYGMGKKTFAWKLKCTPEKVEELLALYYGYFPGVRDFQARVINEVRTKGCLHNFMGRRYVIDPQYAYKGVNYLCQGGAADVLKRAMMRVGRVLDNYKSKMIMTIHDEIVVEIHESEEKFLPKQIVRLMGDNPELIIPLKVSVERANGNWHNLEKVNLKELGL
jgi:DNA polymerase-1